jgi:hypothetical protein
MIKCINHAEYFHVKLISTRLTDRHSQNYVGLRLKKEKTKQKRRITTYGTTHLCVWRDH